MGFEVVATKGTAAAINAAGVPCGVVNKVTEGRPHIVDMIKNNEIVLVINTVEERRNAIADSRQIRTSALLARVTTFTTIAGAEAAVEGMKLHGSPGCDFGAGDARAVADCSVSTSACRCRDIRGIIHAYRRTATFGGFILSSHFHGAVRGHPSHYQARC